MKIFEFENKNDISIKYSHKCGMGHFCGFNFDLELYCSYNKCGIRLEPNDNLHENISNIRYSKYLDIDLEYFNEIYSRLKKINFDIFLETGIIYDASYYYFQISKNNYYFKVKYYEYYFLEPRSIYYKNNDMTELYNIFNDLQEKMDLKKWYDDILIENNIKLILPNP